MVAALLVLVAVAAACAPASPTPVPSPSPSPTPPDLVAPTIASRDPLPNAEIDPRATLRVTFSEPVSGVNGSSFQVLDAAGEVVAATVALDPGGLTATIAPIGGLTIGSTFDVRLTAAVHDLAGNPLAAESWQLRTGNAVRFGAGTYDGFTFGKTESDLTGFTRISVEQPVSATASAYLVLNGHGYLVIDSGTLAGYRVSGTPAGDALPDTAAPIPALPTCSYVDLPATRTAFVDWDTSVLDTIFRLPRGYAPPDLTDTKKAGLNGGYYVRAVALADLAAMVAAAKAASANLAVESAYRSYTGQVLTFNGWVSQVGYRQALLTSARAGHSEHQLGTAIDFRAVGGASAWTYPDWATTKEGSWLAANAWKFGWVMSYPKGESAVTCYSYEPWHYRYVGRTQAAAIHAAGITEREWLWAQGFGIR
jgi:D-alanyl-D-alanine carboxypeptidase